MQISIGGFIPLSLCDFPGKVAAVIFTNGCNLRCPWCHNGHLLMPAGDPARRELNVEQILSRVEELKNRLQGVVVSGGEPTIQPDLAIFLRRLKDFGLLVKLDTNGVNPQIVRELIRDGLVDFVAMDIKAPLSKYSLLAGSAIPDLADRIAESIEIIAKSGLPHQFRTTKVSPLLDDDDCAQIERLVPPGSPFKWQTFVPDNALDPELRAT